MPTTINIGVGIGMMRDAANPATPATINRLSVLVLFLGIQQTSRRPHIHPALTITFIYAH